MSNISDILGLYGELDWYAIRPGELADQQDRIPLFPPLITFRYKHEHHSAAVRLQGIVARYQGKVKWEIGNLTGKNLSLMPCRIKEVQIENSCGSTMDAIEYTIEHEQQFVQQALEDFPSLMAFLRKATNLDSGHG